MKYRRPLAYRGPLDLLQKEGKSALAHELFYDQPDILSKMVVIGPPPISASMSMLSTKWREASPRSSSIRASLAMGGQP